MVNLDQANGKRTRSAALSVLPVVLLSLTIIASISFLSRSAYEQSVHESRTVERQRIETALDNEAQEFAEIVQREVNLMIATASERRIDMERMSRYLSTEHRADFVAVFAKGGKLLSVSASRPELMERRVRAADELIAKRRDLRTPFAIRRIGMSSTLVDPLAYIAMAAIDVNNSFEVVVTRRLEDKDVAKIGRNLMLPNLRFVETEKSSVDAEEAQTLAVTWNHVNTGTLTLEGIANVAHLGILVIAIYGVLVFLHIRRVTHELESSEAAAQHLAGHDPLSGLPNRSLFSRTLNRQLHFVNKSKAGLAVMYLDLDRFKEVNDQHGHEAGDKLIVTVAERLLGLIRGSDTVARFGGDEFAIIQSNVKSPEDCEAMARRILDVLHRPFDLNGVDVSIGASIGISRAPANGTDAATLMRFADVALYRAKSEGRNRFAFFEQEMNESLRLRQIVEDDLRVAIEEEQLILHYQPFVQADGEKVLGVEALVRWKHPTRGMIPPNDFIGVAEERGMIAALGEWVLRKACEDSKRWPDLIVAVNVSPVQFKQRGFVRTVARIIEETGMDPTRLELELTEGVVVADADQAQSAIAELRAMGIKVALDDFGAGYSSLIYLRRFAFDKIKIDRSFLVSMETSGEAAILVHSIVHLGRALGLQVTAEGIETEEQQRFLQAVGCHQLQGYYFARPCPVDQLDKYLVDYSQRQVAA